MLRGARRGARELEASAGTLQGLHRAAEGQHVPIAAYHRDRAAWAADGSADSHARDAQGGGGRNRGALELQGRQRARSQGEGYRAVRVAAAADRMATESQGPAGISFDGQGRSFSRRGFRINT